MKSRSRMKIDLPTADPKNSQVDPMALDKLYGNQMTEKLLSVIHAPLGLVARPMSINYLGDIMFFIGTFLRFRPPMP